MTNEVFSDGLRYDDSTRGYQALLGRLNCALAARADTVTEVVCSVPLTVKGNLP